MRHVHRVVHKGELLVWRRDAPRPSCCTQRRTASVATVADNREQCATVRAVASVFLAHSLGRVPEGSAPIFRHTRVSLLHSVKFDQVSLCAKKRKLDPFIRFD